MGFLAQLMDILNDFKDIWNDWEIRGLVVLSLILQIILIVFGAKRKRIVRIWVRIIVWLVYLSADMVATFALGNLARNQNTQNKLNKADASKNCHDQKSCTHNNLIKTFWAPFFLLHLGGPDTITAYSIQDNELWLRHLLTLVVQVGVAFYIFVRSWTGNRLRYLAIPVFVAGVIKYGERSFSLKCATPKAIKETLRTLHPRQEGNEVIVVPRPSSNPMNNYLHQAYYLFRMSIFLFNDLFLGLTELRDSHAIISAVKSSKEAFKLIEVELGFIYDLFYTKLIIVHSYTGKILRLVSFLSTVSAVVAFSYVIGKGCSYCLIDVQVTYLLLIGALALEVYSFFYLIFSDWTMHWCFDAATISISGAIYSLHNYFSEGKRWSGSIAQYSLISSCLRKDYLPERLRRYGMEEMMKHRYLDWKKVDQDMKDLIFKQLSEKGNQICHKIHDTNLRNKLVDQKGDGVLERMSHDFESTVQFQNLANDIRRIVELEFNHILLIWHIATSLCHNDDHNYKHGNILSSEHTISKRLSDYMMYLLVIRPSMLPKGIGDIDSGYLDGCADVKKFFEGKKPHSEMQACEELLETNCEEMESYIANHEAPPRVFVATGSNKYKLVDGCELARNLKRLPAEEMWKIICEVWIEMLAYAASHCEWKEHTIQLRRGGELLTHVCLLMAHLGLSQLYQETIIDEHKNEEIS